MNVAVARRGRGLTSVLANVVTDVACIRRHAAAAAAAAVERCQHVGTVADDGTGQHWLTVGERELDRTAKFV